MTQDTNEPSGASAGSGAERPLGDPEIAVEILRLRVAELEEAIRRLAEQDATLTKEELKAVRTAAFAYAQNDDDDECAAIAAALLGLAERAKNG